MYDYSGSPSHYNVSANLGESLTFVVLHGYEGRRFPATGYSTMPITVPLSTCVVEREDTVDNPWTPRYNRPVVNVSGSL